MGDPARVAGPVPPGESDAPAADSDPRREHRDAPPVPQPRRRGRLDSRDRLARRGASTAGPLHLPRAARRAGLRKLAARILRGLVDPNDAPLRAEPRDERNLVIAAKNGWVCGLDERGYLPRWLSNAVCRLATGSGFATRMLYEDSEEMVFAASRPVVLNGIEEVVVRGDLLDRSLILTLPTMPDRQRQKEEKLDADLDTVRPAIFGALLNAVATALQNLPTTRLENPPRMADFATWIVAAEPGLPWEPGGFLNTYRPTAATLSRSASTRARSPRRSRSSPAKDSMGPQPSSSPRSEPGRRDRQGRQRNWPTRRTSSAASYAGSPRRSAPSGSRSRSDTAERDSSPAAT